MQDVVSLACVVALSGTNRCSLSYSERIRMLKPYRDTQLREGRAVMSLDPLGAWV